MALSIVIIRPMAFNSPFPPSLYHHSESRKASWKAFPLTALKRNRQRSKAFAFCSIEDSSTQKYGKGRGCRVFLNFIFMSLQNVATVYEELDSSLDSVAIIICVFLL